MTNKDITTQIIENFREKFEDNPVFWNELVAEWHQGDIDLKPFEQFIREALESVRNEAIGECISEIKGNITLETSQALARISDKLKTNKPEGCSCHCHSDAKTILAERGIQCKCIKYCKHCKENL